VRQHEARPAVPGAAPGEAETHAIKDH